MEVNRKIGAGFSAHAGPPFFNSQSPNSITQSMLRFSSESANSFNCARPPTPALS
jgi:hypothetical protein